jgi:uncharacterized protein (TIGR02145 family)
MLVLFSSVSAQTPQRFTYQAVIRNPSNALLANQAVGMRVSILQGSATGTAVYVETHTATTTANGQVNLEIGGGNVVSGTMAGINWSTGSYFMRTETDPAGGTNYSLVNTTRPQSVPYAMHAATAANGVSNGTVSNQMMYWNGTAWVALNPGSNGQVLTICNGTLTWTTGGQCPVTVVPCPPQNVFNTSITYVTMTDQEGNAYKTVTIGTQVWMAENLRTGRYRNGESIPIVSSAASWDGYNRSATCWYGNDSINNHCAYGRLYNWYVVSDSRNLCPSGWHVPSDAEFTTLTNTLGGESVAGGKLKSATGWDLGGNGTNTSGFSGRPGGGRNASGAFTTQGSVGTWWTTTKIGNDSAWLRNITLNTVTVERGTDALAIGRSIRCLKD